MKRLSIVIPIYNSEKYIDNFLNILLKQIDKKQDEIILINDGSKDTSEEKCKKYQEKYKENIQLYTTTNGGPSKARNYGLKKANGKYLIFLDIDDCIENNYIEEMLKHIEKFDLVICGYNLIKVDKKEKAIINMSSQEIKKENIISLLKNNQMLNTLWNKIYKLDIIKENNIKFDEKEFRGEDLLFNLDYIANLKKSILIIDEILYNYYMKNTGLNLGYNEKLIIKIKRTNKIYRKMVKITENKEKIFFMTIKSYIYHIIFYTKNIIKKKLKKKQ